MAAVNKALNPNHSVGSPLNLGRSNLRRDDTLTGLVSDLVPLAGGVDDGVGGFDLPSASA